MSINKNDLGYPKGFLCPVVIKIIGFGDNQRIRASWGNWVGSDHYVNGDFQKAHKDAEDEAKNFLKK